jgi:hypothetical protein
MKIEFCKHDFRVFLILLLLSSPLFSKTYVEKGESSLVKLSPDGRLIYQKDDKGNRIPDFSMVGYHFGEKDIPNVEVKLTLLEKKGDDVDLKDNNWHELKLVFKKNTVSMTLDGKLWVKE